MIYIKIHIKDTRPGKATIPPGAVEEFLRIQWDD